MQIIVELKMDAAGYAAEQRHGLVPAPQTCPNRGRARSLEAHGYYRRWVSNGKGKPVRIAVRRFFVGIAQ
jgi:hypothetical protein